MRRGWRIFLSAEMTVLRLQVPTRNGLRTFEVPSLPCIIGSDDAADVRLRHPSVLPNHALMRHTTGGIELRVIGDGAALRNGDGAVSRVVIADGMRLLIGAVPVHVVVGAAAGEPPAAGVPRIEKATPAQRAVAAAPARPAPQSRSRAEAQPEEGPTEESGQGEAAPPAGSPIAKVVAWMSLGVLVASLAVKLVSGGWKFDVHSVDKQVWIGLAIVVGLIGLVIMIAGAAKRVVIYYSGWDLLNSLGAVVLPVVSAGMFGSDHAALKWLGGPLLLLCGLACLVANYVLAARHNRSAMVGAIVGTFKIVFGTLSLILLYGQYQRLTSKKTTTGEKIQAVIVSAIVIAIAAAMINGPAVYQAKGWSEPEEDASDDNDDKE